MNPKSQISSFFLSLFFVLPLMAQTKSTIIQEASSLSISGVEVGQWEGKKVFRYTLDNGTMQVELTNFGGIISRIIVPDKDGNLENVVLALEEIPDYFTKNGPYLGAAVGRYANRIGGASFKLQGETYHLTKNNGAHTLHGGAKGFGVKVWNPETYKKEDAVGVKMTYLSVDGEEGFPGNLETTLWMELTAANELKLRFESTTDKPTVVNLTNHSYFNLNGMTGDVRDHELQIFAEAITPTGPGQIPTGELQAVAGTPFDFQSSKNLGQQLDQVEVGFDHNFVTKTENSSELQKIAIVKHPASGRVMEVFSTAPGVQLYTSNHMRDFKGAEGKTYQPHWALCLEPEGWPDSPNKPNFPSTNLAPGDQYEHEIVYQFHVVH
ncbi:galactose mutarotase [Algoriphagus halophytocola]|uniref:Aldose 1-epimerase n=1 Tax=Algoriphagus halophytocola TaxID=2991499 RepID=A0ABY6MFW6_9BACT|nr:MULTISPECIES: aldose epimerase family protein [unclassified Algoriphagus]UZD22686.1 galactose mutarotase [Algoriphagus sp. TR-M5]WBL43951.1 galactose mutarotase [Algoriphagus sp. TR-M9]